MPQERLPDENIPVAEEVSGAEDSMQDVDTEKAVRLQNAKIRKKLIMVLAGIVLALVLLLGTVLLLDTLNAGNHAVQLPEIEFEPTYQGNIFEYDRYLALNPEVIMYAIDASGNISFSIDKNNEELDSTVWFLRDFIRSMTVGSADLYNSFFNDTYFQTHERQAPFSPQMIYQAEIRFISTTKDANGDMIYEYQLRYRILQNDGSLRKDVGSDAIVPQVLTLRAKADGSIAIEGMYSIINITK